MTSYANPSDLEGEDWTGFPSEGWNEPPDDIVPNLDQFADLYRGLDTGQLNDLYLNFAEQYKDVFTPEQIQQVGSALFGGNLEEDFVVDDKGRIISTGGATDAGARMPGSGESNITQRGGASSLLDKLLGNKNLLSAGLGGLGALLSYKSAKDAMQQAKGAKFESRGPATATRSAFKGTRYAASGGIMDLFKDGIREREDVLDPNDPFMTIRGGYDTPYAIDELNAFKAFASGLGIDPYSFIKQTKGAPEFNVPTSLMDLYEPVRESFGLTHGKTATELEQAMRAEGGKRSEQYHKSVADEARARQVAEDQRRQDAYLASRPREDVPLASSGAAYEAERARSLANLKAQQAAARDTSNPLNVFGVDEFDPATNQIITRSETTEELLRRGIDPTGSAAQRRSGETPRGSYNTADYMEVNGKIVPKPGSGAPPWTGAMGGVAALAQGRYLDGHSDGMADKVPAHIDNKRPAALSDGEFVIPADVVSHLGNGNSNAGAKRLYEMMDRIRAARTGNPKQGKQINPDKFMPR